MKKYILFVLACALMVVLAACKAPSSTTETDTTGGYQTISPDEVKTKLDNGESFTLVDVRRTDEYEESHIPSAIHIANEDIGDTQPEALSDLDAPIIVYCRSGRRSQEAANKLIAMGYTNVKDMGGIQDWKYDTVTGSEAGTWTATPATDKAGILSSFATTDLNGNAIDQSVLADHKLTMVNVWATFCGPCLSEMPDLGELAAEYEDKGVQIIGLTSDVLNTDGSLSDSQIKTAQEIVVSTKADYLHIVPSEDLFGLVAQITSVPTTFFVDENGKQVGSAYLGAKSKEAWKAIIEETLAEVSE